MLLAATKLEAVKEAEAAAVAVMEMATLPAVVKVTKVVRSAVAEVAGAKAAMVTNSSGSRVSSND